VLINNFLYQSVWQIDQRVFILFVLFLLIAILFLKNRINKSILFLGCILCWATVVTIMFHIEDLFYIHRSIINTVVALSYILVFGLSRKMFFLNGYLHNNYFYLTTLVVCIGAIALLLGVDRHDIPNVNWWPMTLFFILGMSRYRNKLGCYIVLFIISYFIYESRGVAVSAIVSISLFIGFLFSVKWSVRIFSFLFISSVYLFMIFISFYASNQDVVNLFVGQISERAFSSREIALVEGWKVLEASNYFGDGIGAEASFERAEKSVQVHFGFLDLSLKFSLYFASVIMLYVFFLIKNYKHTFFPAIAGAVMSVFYYNGFGISHEGLNLLLFMLLGATFSLKNDKQVTN